MVPGQITKTDDISDRPKKTAPQFSVTYVNSYSENLQTRTPALVLQGKLQGVGPGVQVVK